VRFVYVDESGISVNHTHLVVAGIVVHGDVQLNPVEGYMRHLIKEYVAEEDRNGFAFHATELFSGSGKVFSNRDKYPLTRRLEALKEVLSVPGKFKLPVVFGFLQKGASRESCPTLGVQPSNSRPSNIQG
jgi:hypothetical protein